MGEDIYIKLREHLDSQPGGFPEANSGVEMRILEKLFSPEDAELAVCLSRAPESPEAVAERCGMDAGEVAERLESMAKRGLIVRVRRDGEALYRAEQFLVGIYEHQLGMDREFAEMAQEYLLYVGMAQRANDTEQMRIVPVASTVEVTSDIASYDQIRELIKEKAPISAAPCLCR